MQSETDYYAWHVSPPPRSRLNRLLACALAITLSFGSHASMQALAPAESVLASLGVTPLGYAALTIAPMALGLFSPLVWGRLWDHHRGLACVIAPVGEFLGALLVALGLFLHAGSSGWLSADLALVAGFLFISGCKAGVSIVEFSTVGQVSGRHSVLGFACVVLVKHVIGILMSWGVPRILSTTDDAVVAISRVQLILILPHSLSVLAGVALARMHCCGAAAHFDATNDDLKAHALGSGISRKQPSASPIVLRRSASPVATRRLASPVAARRLASPVVAHGVASPARTPLTRVASLLGLSESSHLIDSAGDDLSDGPGLRDTVLSGSSQPTVQSWIVVALIGLWRALAVGTLHAYHLIRIKFMQSRGMGLTAAGSLFAVNDGIGLALLPLTAMLCRRTAGLKWMLTMVPIATFGATLVLLCATLDVPYMDGVPPRASILLLSITEAFVPIIPLALLPANASSLGTAFGAIEVVFIVTQMAINLLVGVARTISGYSGAFAVMAASFAATIFVSLPVIMHSRDHRSRTFAADFI